MFKCVKNMNGNIFCYLLIGIISQYNVSKIYKLKNKFKNTINIKNNI